ncbi:cupin domain-containing protein [Streptomyces sp. CA-132043]|uniref:cupin domain-containing protein n=1 Tax=Streptomyces sp. CA-132043 TaxID=3240048 RepID=UPI003D8D75C3
MTEHTTTQHLKTAVRVDGVDPVEIGPGVTARRLPRTAYSRGWLLDFAPGSQFPVIDEHATEERYYVLSGEIIEGDERHPAGTYVVFAPGSRHQPRTDVGAQIIGYTVLDG